MSPVDFSVDIVNQYAAFYMLDNINDDGSDISISLMSTEGKTESPVDARIMRIPDGRLVACVQASFPNMMYNNLEVDNESSSQIVNLQVYERLRRYYKLDARNDNKSLYFFADSIKIDDSQDPDGTLNSSARCHYGLLGPEVFTKDGSAPVSVVDHKKVTAFEPIFSVNGIAHLCFAQGEIDMDFYTDADPFPRFAFSLQEQLRQLVEWALVNDKPFNNQEKISNNAKMLLTKLNFTDAEISHIVDTQPQMQIAKYLSGDLNAQRRPDSPGILTDDIDKMIQRRLSHCAFSHFAKLHDIDIKKTDMQKIKNARLEMAEFTMRRVLGDLFEPVTDNNIDKLKRELFKKQMVPMAVLLETVNSMAILTKQS